MIANFTWMSAIMKKHRLLTVVVVGLSMFLSVARMTHPWVQKIFIDSVLGQKRADLLPMIAALSLGAAVVELGTMLLNTYISVLYSQGILVSLREQIYGEYRDSSYSTQAQVKPGKVVSLMLSDASALGETFMNVVPSLGTTVGTLFVNMAVLIALNYRLFLISLLFLPVYLIGPSKFSPVLYRRGREVQVSVENLNTVLQDGLSGTLDIYCSDARRWDVKRIMGAAKEIMSGYKRQAVSLQWLASSILGPLLISQTVLLVVGGYFVINGTMQLGVLLAYLTYTSSFFNSCKEIFRVSASLAGPKAAWDRIREFLGTLDPQPETEMPVESGVPSIELTGMAFGYQPDSPILQDVNLTVGQGSTLCVVGPSGSGKSTLLQVVSGLLKPWRGACRVSGIDLFSVNPSALRQVGTYVGPNPRMFHATVRENVLLGREMSQGELGRICDVSGMSEFVKGLPDGLDTVLGDKGFALSLGQQQRVGLARALVSKPKILLLDEALSGLDTSLANEVFSQLKKLQDSGIIVLATHRADARAYADRSVVMENGRVVALGNQLAK